MKAISLMLICPKEIIWFLPDNFYLIFLPYKSYKFLKKLVAINVIELISLEIRKDINKQKCRLVLKNKAAFLNSAI